MVRLNTDDEKTVGLIQNILNSLINKEQFNERHIPLYVVKKKMKHIPNKKIHTAVLEFLVRNEWLLVYKKASDDHCSLNKDKAKEINEFTGYSIQDAIEKYRSMILK